MEVSLWGNREGARPRAAVDVPVVKEIDSSANQRGRGRVPSPDGGGTRRQMCSFQPEVVQIISQDPVLNVPVLQVRDVPVLAAQVDVDIVEAVQFVPHERGAVQFGAECEHPNTSNLGDCGICADRT